MVSVIKCLKNKKHFGNSFLQAGKRMKMFQNSGRMLHIMSILSVTEIICMSFSDHYTALVDHAKKIEDTKIGTALADLLKKSFAQIFFTKPSGHRNSSLKVFQYNFGYEHYARCFVYIIGKRQKIDYIKVAPVPKQDPIEEMAIAIKKLQKEMVEIRSLCSHKSIAKLIEASKVRKYFH